jgi:hypothetical protein
MEEMIAEIKEKQAEIKRLQKELQERSSEIFLSSFKKLFEETPKLQSFGWTQYTPYFNDGDTCYFSVHTDYLYVNGDYQDSANWINEKKVISWGTYNRDKRIYEGRIEEDNPEYDKELSEAVDKVRTFLKLFDKNFYQSQFGDHTLVTVTPNGIETEEYEHD